jgi:hypothetical protein
MADDPLSVGGVNMTGVSPLRVLLKAFILFVLVNLLYALIQPPVSRISVYTRLFPGRERLPFGEMHNPYVVSIDDIDAMFAAHAIAADKKRDEVRVAVIGDSSVWGENLSLHETLTGQWNQLDVQCGAKRMHVYNLGYPHPSAVKDLLFLKKLTEYEPDVIVWLSTLNTLSSMQVNPVLVENRDKALELLDEYQLAFSGIDTLRNSKRSLLEKTIVGERSFLARLIKLQALGWLWSATGRDVERLAEPVSMPADVSDNLEYRRLPVGSDLRTIMLVDALAAGHAIVGKTPLVLVNEPIYVANGLNSDLRYNDFYPRWAYDQYREVIAGQAHANDWVYIDLWDFIPREYFTDTPLHLSLEGERLLAERIHEFVLPMVCQ